MEFGSTSTQMLATAFTFGASATAFAYLPFLFVLVHGLIKANGGHNAHSSSVLSVFMTAFLVHFIACIAFMIGIKLLDVLSAVNHQNNYLQEKIFGIFWARGQGNVLTLVNSKGTSADEAAYLQLYIVQMIEDWLMIGQIWFVFAVGFAYAVIQIKKDPMHFNVVNFCSWLLVGNLVGFFIYYIWAQIASLALFIPSGGTLVSKTIEAYQNLVGN